ncbi:TatD family hydrolase [Aneurinibacillus sp. Ricciae_BoGa-3]|uniref:TatD family hydrolase n=1 Tax=Aneurinibacillus sp. Ricciae_BoGa-3 TaxID=3022697 RepID=UPI002340256A|nr:TatD family hydrolase [Aneurinibacillus sp. Ricciae_BoGa-3]WCK52721.1 TatD family hydrolase [Aneurinibacillus sp. Ricciae_BoGa-3]
MIYDSHIHLDAYTACPADLAYAIEQWMEAGITGVIAVSTDLASAYRTLELQRAFPDFVHAAAGFHPERQLPSDREISEMLQLIATERDRLAAIGEVGLPHYSEHTKSLSHYTELLEIFAGEAVKHKLPLVLHAVHDKAEIALSILQKHKVPTAHFHWLKAPEPVLQRIIASRYYISVTPEVCYRTRDQLLLKKLPNDRFMLETDGPWPFTGVFSHNKTTPLFLLETARQAARVRAMDLDTLLVQASANTRRCYGISEG